MSDDDGPTGEKKEAMSTLEKINAEGGTVVLRVISGVLALATLVGMVASLAKGLAGLYGFAVGVVGLILFGGYALRGNKMKASDVPDIPL